MKGKGYFPKRVRVVERGDKTYLVDDERWPNGDSYLVEIACGTAIDPQEAQQFLKNLVWLINGDLEERDVVRPRKDKPSGD